jgi:hypothetical protein
MLRGIERFVRGRLKGSCQESGQRFEVWVFGGSGCLEAMHERTDAVGCTHSTAASAKFRGIERFVRILGMTP